MDYQVSFNLSRSNNTFSRECPLSTGLSHTQSGTRTTHLQGQLTKLGLVAFLKFLTFSSGHDGQRRAQKLRIEDGQKVSLGGCLVGMGGHLVITTYN